MRLRQANSWEALYALEGFIAPLDKARMLIGSVVGQYEMPEPSGLRPCGIDQCATPHRHGFIVEIPNTGVSHVGRQCGKKHFGAGWNQQLKRFRSAQKAVAKEQGLREARERGAQALMEPQQYDQVRLNRVRLYLKAFDGLPVEIRAAIESRAAVNDNQIFGFRDPSAAEIKQAKFYDKRLPARIQYVKSRLEGLLALSPSQRPDHIIDDRIPAIRRALKESLDGNDAGEIDKQLRCLKGAEEDLQRSFLRTDQFFTNENIAKLCDLPSAQKLGFTHAFIVHAPKPKIELT